MLLRSRWGCHFFPSPPWSLVMDTREDGYASDDTVVMSDKLQDWRDAHVNPGTYRIFSLLSLLSSRSTILILCTSGRPPWPI